MRKAGDCCCVMATVCDIHDKNAESTIAIIPMAWEHCFRLGFLVVKIV